jgi:hypothetical protein
MDHHRWKWVHVDLRIFRSGNIEVCEAIWKFNELFACRRLSLDKSDVSGVNQFSFFEVPK